MAQTEDSSDEEERERYRELLEELRTILPGVQVLLAFLLTVPFASRFPELDRFAQVVFGLSLAGVAAAVVVLLAPAAFHRLGKRRDRRDRLRLGIKAEVVGLGLLAMSIAADAFVVARFVSGSTVWGLILFGIVVALVLIVWVALPLRERFREGS